MEVEILYNENKETQKKIKYSMWDTRIDEKQLKIIQKSPVLTEGSNPKKNNK